MTPVRLLSLLLAGLFSAFCTLFTWWQSGRKRVRQVEAVTSVTASGVMEGENVRQGERIAFPFSPFSSPLADSEELMKEQYDNLLSCYFMFFTVLSGLGSYGSCHSFNIGTVCSVPHCECQNLKSVYILIFVFVIFFYIDTLYI